MPNIRQFSAPFLVVVGRVSGEGEETRTYTDITPEQAMERFTADLQVEYDTDIEVYIHAVMISDSRIYIALSNY